MARVRLSSRAHKILEQIVRSCSDARQVRRAQVLLWLHDGEHPNLVAEHAVLTRQAMYAIVQRYEARKAQPDVACFPGLRDFNSFSVLDSTIFGCGFRKTLKTASNRRQYE